MTFGSTLQLNERERATVETIVKRFGATIGPVKVFGSRALGTARPNSDLDLVIFPPISNRNLRSLAAALEESDLPFTVDLVAWDDIASTSLRNEIELTALPILAG